MIRWFVRRVVKYILEELSNSKDFEAILDRLSAGGFGNRYVDVKGVPLSDRGNGGSKTNLEADSMSKLVGTVVQRSEGVELSGNIVLEKVVEGGKVNQSAIDRLSNLGAHDR